MGILEGKETPPTKNRHLLLPLLLQKLTTLHIQLNRHKQLRRRRFLDARKLGLDIVLNARSSPVVVVVVVVVVVDGRSRPRKPIEYASIPFCGRVCPVPWMLMPSMALP